MNELVTFRWPFSGASVEKFGWVLVHSFWQFALLVLIAGIVGQAMRRSSALARYAMLVVAMAVMIVVPLATWMCLPSEAPDHLASRRASALGQDSNDVSPGADASRLASDSDSANGREPLFIENNQRTEGVSPLVEGRSLDSAATKGATKGLTPPVRQGVLSWSERSKTVLRPWLAWIVVGWILGVVVCSLRPLLGWHTLRRLKRVGVSPASDDVLAALSRVSERLGLRRAVCVLQSTLAQVPVVVGYLRPVILRPVSLMTSIPAAQLEAILAHELAHVRRHDFAVNLLQTLVETIFFYHPAVWWLSRQIRVEREHCCDDLVVASLGNRVEYGRALLAIEELRGQSTVLALGATDGSLLSRVRRIAGINSDLAASSMWSMLCLAICCLGVILGLSALGWYGLADERRDDKTTAKSDSWPDDKEVAVAGSTDSSNTDAASKPDGSLIWGDPVNRLRARVVPVRSSMSEDAIDLAQRVAHFERFDEVAFAVEVENVSDKPIKLLDTRWKGGSGRANSDWFGQFLFAVDYLDEQGRPIAQADVQLLESERIKPLDDAASVTLEPNQTQRYLLRPSKWLGPQTVLLKGAKPRAVVKYRGDASFVTAPAEFAVRSPIFQRFHPQSVARDAKDVGETSKQIEKKDADLPVWGAATNGLRTALVMFRPYTHITHGDHLLLYIAMQNVSDQPISFASKVRLHNGMSAVIKNEKGGPLDVHHTRMLGRTLECRVTLKPQQTVIFDAGNLGLAATQEQADNFEFPLNRKLVAPAGNYTLQLTGPVGNFPERKDAAGKLIAPLEGDWNGQLTTGEIPLTIMNDGLAFLKPYPKLHGLSLDMTEPQFLEFVRKVDLKTRKTVDGDKVQHHIALGDGHTLIVMFDKDAKCSGIQRVRGEDDDRVDGIERNAAPKRSPNPLVAVLQPAAANARLDSSGEAMPVGMVQRLGSTRFKVPGWWRRLAFAGNDEWVWLKADGRVSVIHRESGRIVKHDQLRLGEGSVRTLTASADGTQVAIGMFEFPPDAEGQTNYRVVVMSALTTAHLQELKWKALPSDLNCLSFSGDGQTLLTGTQRGDVRLWDVETGKQLRQHAFEEGADLRDAALSPDGRSAVLGGWRESFLWQHADNVAPIKLVKRRGDSVSFAPNGRLFSTIGRDGPRLWNAATGELIAHLKSKEFESYSDADFGHSFTPDSKVLAVPLSSYDVVELWDVESKQRLATLPVHQPRGVAISRDGRWLAALGQDSATTIFDLKTRKQVSQPGDGHGQEILSVRFAGVGSLVSTSVGDARVWDIQTGKLQHTLSHQNKTTTVRGLATSPDGTLIVTSGFDDTLGVWDRATGKRLLTLKGHGTFGGSRAVQFQADGRQFVSWGDDAVLRWWNPKDGRLLSAQTLEVPGYKYGEDGRDALNSFRLNAAFAPDAKSLFVAYGELFEFDTRTGQRLRRIPADRTMVSSSASPDGRWLATAERVADLTSTIVLRDRATLKVVREWLVSDPREAVATDTSNAAQGNDSPGAKKDYQPTARFTATGGNGMTFSPDSKRLAWSRAGTRNGIDIAEVASDRLVASIPIESGCWCLDFSPDGTRIVSGHHDSTASVWDLTQPAFVVGLPPVKGEYYDANKPRDAIKRIRPTSGKVSPWPTRVVPGARAVGTESQPTSLEFLKPYPKLHGLSLDMTEKQFLEIVKKQDLKPRKTAEGETFQFRIALGDDHTLIVMFRQDSTCSGIQRVRGEDAADEKPGAPVQQEPQKPKSGAELSGRLFVNAGLRTTKDETRFSQSAIAIDPNTGSWTRLRNLSESGFTVPLSHVRVSPDGRTMFFMQENEIWKCDAMTGDRAERVLEKGSPAAWSPDGKTFIGRLIGITQKGFGQLFPALRIDGDVGGGHNSTKLTV